MMTEQEVVDLMKSSRSAEEWDANCDRVKASHNGYYPPFWWKAVVASGLARSVTRDFPLEPTPTIPGVAVINLDFPPPPETA